MDITSSPLGGLPVEVFEMILEYLAPPTIPTLLPPPTADQDNTNLDIPDRECWQAWFDKRRDLLNLSLVSRGFRNHTEPHLWRSVAFRSGISRQGLTETVTDKPSLGKHIKGIYGTVVGPFDGVPFDSAMMAQLLASTPNVEDVLFSQTVTIGTHNLRTWDMLPPVFAHARKTMLGSHLAPHAAPHPSPLPKLKTFRFRQVRDPEEPSVCYGLDIIPVLPFISTLGTLELWRDSVNTWNHNLAPPGIQVAFHDTPFISWPRLDQDFPMMPNLKAIRLHGTEADEWQVTNLVLACPELVELVVKFAGTYVIEDGVDAGNEDWDEEGSDDEDMEDADGSGLSSGASSEGSAQGADEAMGDVPMEDVPDEDEEMADLYDPAFGPYESDLSSHESDNEGQTEPSSEAGVEEADMGGTVEVEDDGPSTEAGVAHTDPPHTPLTTAIERAAGTLRTLSITGCGCASYLDRQDSAGDAEPLPQDNWLLPLPDLKDLEHLTVDLWCLFGNIPNLEVPHTDLLVSRIPPSITSLTLSMNWDIDHSDEGWPDRDALHAHELLIVVAALTKLARDPARRLRSINLVHPRFPGNPGVRQLFENALGRLRAGALEAGVKVETTEYVGWVACHHPIGVRYTPQSRRHVARRGWRPG